MLMQVFLYTWYYIFAYTQMCLETNFLLCEPGIYALYQRKPFIE